MYLDGAVGCRRGGCLDFGLCRSSGSRPCLEVRVLNKLPVRERAVASRAVSSLSQLPAALSKTRRRAFSEAAFHRSVAQYLSLVLPKDCFWTTFPAGGGGKIRGAQLKAMGLRPGVPDILILRRTEEGNRSHVFWIELKSPEAPKPRAVQEACHEALFEAGCDVAVCRHLADIRRELEGWGIVKAGKGRAA
jgi:hypothetical protein